MRRAQALYSAFVPGGVSMARFQGNIHEGSNRAASLVLFVVFIILAALVAAYFMNPDGFAYNWNNFWNTLNSR